MEGEDRRSRESLSETINHVERRRNRFARLLTARDVPPERLAG